MNFKINLKPKHMKLITHFNRFIDKHRYPRFSISKKITIAFFKQQTYGYESLTPNEKVIIEPLINAQENKELTLKMIYEEMADFWSKGWGWYIPLLDTIKSEFKTRHIHKDKIFIKALVKIAKFIQKNNFVDALINFTGLSNEEKERFLSLKLKLT